MMSRDRDLELALKLQAQFDEEAVREIAENEQPSTGTASTAWASSSSIDEHDAGFGEFGSVSQAVNPSLKQPMSIVDERWELLDPNPDMRAMFLEFNDKYFWGRLAGVEVRWSPRMTLCAGLCCYEGHGGLCSIRLSAPLLKLRPRKDLVETLLHEMIHAYLFVTANNRDHDGHGPEFCKHMNRLNQSTGTNITIYHNFHDEVDVYRQHWWRCNGPCQKRPPYYGMVRRAMNRAPSKRDPWWAEHQRTCGGSYTKVKEPEGYGVKKGTKRKKADADEDDIENDTKKRATDDVPTSSFPGKGFRVGGTGSTSRLVPPKMATLDKFLKKVEGPKKSPGQQPPQSSPASRSQSEEEVEDASQDNQSKNARLRALAAIFDSDDSDEEDIVIVKFDKPLKEAPSNGFQIGETSTSDSKARSSQPDGCHAYNSGLPTQSSSQHADSSPTSKPEVISQPDAASKTKNSGASTSKGAREDHGKKQDSIMDAFSRMRQQSGKTDYVPRDSEANERHQDGSFTRNTTKSTEQGESRTPDNEMVNCPVCQCKVERSKINQHLDQCLS